MPASTRDLESTLHRALSIAGEKGHCASLHLVLTLVDDSEGKALRGCRVDPEHEAARLLLDAGLTRYDATRHVSHGVRNGRDEPLDATASTDPNEEMRVMLLDDDDTPMAFVGEKSRTEFDKGEDEAVCLMLEIHRKGFAPCGAYPRETAAAKVAVVAELARDRKHPLDCVTEPTRGLADALLFTKPRTIAASGPGDRQRA